MTAESEVCNGSVSEVVGIEVKSGLGAGSLQDLSKTDFNGIRYQDQANDPKNSNALVTDVDDLSADGKDIVAADASLRHESSDLVEALESESDALDVKPEGGDVRKHLSAGSGDESFTLVNGVSAEQVISIVAGGREQDAIEEGNKCLEELNDQNGKFDVVDGEVKPTSTEGVDGNVVSTDEIPSTANGIHVGPESSVQDGDVGIADCWAESEILKDEDSNGKIERSEEGEVARVDAQNGKIGVVAEAEPDKVEDQLILEAVPGVEENQGSKFLRLELVADRGEEDEPKSLLSPFDKHETVEDEVESASGKEAMKDQKSEIDPESNIHYELNKGKAVVINADCDAGTACDEVLEGKDVIFSVSHFDGSIIYSDDAVQAQYGNGATTEISDSERESGFEVHGPTTEVQTCDTDTVGVISSSMVDGSESEIFGNEHIHTDSLERNVVNGVSSASDSEIREVVSNEKELVSQGSGLSGDFEDDYILPVSAVNLEPEVQNFSAADHVALTSNKDAASGTNVSDSFVFYQGTSNSMSESADVKDMVGSASGSDCEILLLAKNRDGGNFHSVDISMASLESTSDTIAKEDVSVVARTKPFTFFVRIPRYIDEELQVQIRDAELELEQKTKFRDSIQSQIQEKRVQNQSHGVDYDCAKSEDRSVKKLLKEKRMEIDSLQSIINKAKNAITVEDLNSRIKTIEHTIQHDTLPLKEEKLFIHEIKQLKHLREQLSSSKCSQNEIQQALEQREQAEARLKILRKELGNLKDRSSKAQTTSNEAESKYNDEHRKVKELYAKFKAADDVRQEAYAKFLCLSKKFSQKRKNFSKVKHDSSTASYYAFTDDTEALYSHCVNEVENFMKLWNGSDEFRKEYVRLNTRSTLRRFGTLDGRSLGPNEKPPILPSYVSERNDKMVSKPANADLVSQSPNIELKPGTTVEKVSSDIHSSEKETESKNQKVIAKGLAKSILVNNLAIVPGVDEIQEEQEPLKTKEELELIRKAEEIRRKEAEAKLKEQRRLEEISKAQEARERKKQREEKTQIREELRAKKEAELKEKEREKRLRKKERRKATSDPAEVQDDTSTTTCMDISKKEDTSTQVNDISTKKPKTSWAASKRNKARSAPPPSLRNRNRRKWQQWMWVSLIIFVVVVLFWLGNMGAFSNVNSKLHGSG